MIQIIIAITTTTAMIPATAPALNIPVITEQLLKVNSANANNKKCKFFMVNVLIDKV
jgi:hypothetical protein